MIAEAPRPVGDELGLSLSLEPVATRAPFHVHPAEARRRLAKLSPRQREVTDLIAGGFRGDEIAAKLGIRCTTVLAHRDTINITLGTHGPRDVLALVRAAQQDDGEAPAEEQELTARERLATLAPREREVFGLLAKGNTMRAAAARIGTSYKTVEAIARRVKLKLDAHVAQFAALAESALAESAQSGGDA